MTPKIKKLISIFDEKACGSSSPCSNERNKPKNIKIKKTNNWEDRKVECESNLK